MMNTYQTKSTQELLEMPTISDDAEQSIEDVLYEFQMNMAHNFSTINMKMDEILYPIRQDLENKTQFAFHIVFYDILPTLSLLRCEQMIAVYEILRFINKFVNKSSDHKHIIYMMCISFRASLLTKITFAGLFLTDITVRHDDIMLMNKNTEFLIKGYDILQLCLFDIIRSTRQLRKIHRTGICHIIQHNRFALNAKCKWRSLEDPPHKWHVITTKTLLALIFPFAFFMSYRRKKCLVKCLESFTSLAWNSEKLHNRIIKIIRYGNY